MDGIIQEMIKAVQTPPSTFALPGTKDPLDSIDMMSKSSCLSMAALEWAYLHLFLFFPQTLLRG